MKNINAVELNERQVYINKRSHEVIASAIEVHKSIGPGLLESSYKHCLAYELSQKGLIIEVEKALPLVYKEVKLDCGYRADIVVENKIVIEVKDVEALNDLHLAQALTCLRLSGCTLALLMNFNVDE